MNLSEERNYQKQMDTLDALKLSPKTVPLRNNIWTFPHRKSRSF